MFVGVSVFGEHNGHRRWDFSESGRLLTSSTPALEVSLLDQSVNQAFSRATSLIVLVRVPLRDGILAWIGLYRYVREARGGSGAQGAGIWLRDAASNGHATLSFLDSLANILPTLNLAHWATQPKWSQLDPDNALLDTFARHAQLQPVRPIQLDRPETNCLVDLTADDGAYEPAVLLSEVQTAQAFTRFTRIFLSDDTAVSRQLGTRVESVWSASADSARVRPKADADLEPVRADRPGKPLAQISAELDQLSIRVNEDYTSTKRRDDRTNRLLARLSRTDQFARWMGLPALLFCLLVSVWQAVLWTGFVGPPPVRGTLVANADTPPISKRMAVSPPAAATQPVTTDKSLSATTAAPAISGRTTDPTTDLHDALTRCVELIDRTRKTTFSQADVLDMLHRCLQPSGVSQGSVRKPAPN